MAKKPTQDLDHVRRTAELFKHMSDPTRFRILMLLQERPHSVGELASLIGTSQPALSHHLAILRHARIVLSQRDGKRNLYQLTDAGRSLANAAGALAA